ncbi:MAG: oxidoreductase, partial [Planctomycetota bacterium]
RVIATPHIGGYTRESVTRAVGAAVDAILSELAK